MSVRTAFKLIPALVLACLAVAPQAANAATLAATPNVKWAKPIPLENPHKGGALDAVSCAINNVGKKSTIGQQLCVVVDATGHVWWTTKPWDRRGAWKEAKIDGKSGSSLTGVSCATTTYCVAIDNLGDVMVSKRPTGGAKYWSKPVQVDSTAAAGGGPAGLSGISCPTTTLCVAVDNASEVVTSTRPGGGASAWTAAAIPGGATLTSVACPSATLCVIGGSTRYDSTSPTGGASAWTASGGVAHGVLVSLSCPSIAACVGVGYGNATDGLASATATPTGVAKGWLGTTIDTQPPTGHEQLLDSVSCPSVGFCVAIDGGDDAFDSTSPLTGKWAAITAANPTSTSTWSAISCDRKNCVVADSRGLVIGATVHGVPLTAKTTTTSTATTTTTTT